MGAKLLIIALDGADCGMLLALAEAGRLPNIAKLMARGSFSRMDNSGEFTDDSPWASFCFGAPPSSHGRFSFLERRANGRNRMVFQREDGRATFWAKLSGGGRRVAVIDVPKCPDPVELDGFQISDWLVHGKYRDEPVSFPASLAGETVRDFGASPESRCDYYSHAIDGDEGRDFADHLKRTVRQKLQCGLHHLGREDWDLFIIGFKEAHCAGHMLWHLHRPGEKPDYDPVADIHCALDEAVGELVDAAGEDAGIMVFSPYDMVPNGSVWHLSEALCAGLDTELRRRFERPGLASVQALARRLRKRSTAVCEPVTANDNLLAVHIAQPWGSRKSEVCVFAETLLRELRDKETGGEVFVSVERPLWNTQGRTDILFPDIVATCAPGRFPHTVYSAALGEITADAPAMRSGNHVSGGALILCGDTLKEAGDGVSNLYQLAGLIETAVGR
ncbi:alkaline phosphatase family protein [Nitratireductor sp. XY-223]|uniref:alkaline phosphatase family protein n=1 Tax=Nitratireductor sp. XY-223 TaxID=2561926 RepID=UPI00145ABF56|nr:alkaline phosphatase family protein [Nitratireductor sp. XY-223]